MDATPLTLGQEFSSWAMQLEHGEQRIVDSMKRLAKLPQGGTAVGTGLNTLEVLPATQYSFTRILLA